MNDQEMMLKMFNSIISIQNNLGAMQSDFIAMKSDIDGIKNDIKKMGTDIVTMQNDISMVEKNIVNIQSDFSSMQCGFAGIDNRVTSWEDKLNASFNGLNQEMTILKDNVVKGFEAVELNFSRVSDETAISDARFISLQKIVDEKLGETNENVCEIQNNIDVGFEELKKQVGSVNVELNEFTSTVSKLVDEVDNKFDKIEKSLNGCIA